MNPKIGIIIVNWNGKEDTLECLESLSVLTYTNVETIVVDNGSTNDSVQVISSVFPQITLICNDKNLGFAGGNNVGIKHAISSKCDYIYLLNNDTIVKPNVLNAFLEHMNALNGPAILGSKVYLFEDKTRFDHLGGIWNEHEAQFDLLHARSVDDGIQFEKPIEVDYVCGCSLFAPASAFQELGLLEEKYFLFWEESDFCFRAKKNGYSVFVSPHAKIWHKVSASFVGGKPHTTYFWWRNRLLFIDRNLSKEKKEDVYRNTIVPDGMHILKLFFLKTFQLLILKLLRKHEKYFARKQKWNIYKASLHGIKDYLLRNFGNAPLWVFQPNKSTHSTKIN